MRQLHPCRLRKRIILAAGVAILISSVITFGIAERAAADEPQSARETGKASAHTGKEREATTADTARRSASIQPNRPAKLEEKSLLHSLPSREDAYRSVQTVALFGLISLAPIAILMVTAFVRINIVLILLRQALGSPQIPGNQILTALALLLTALVMRPHAERVYHDAVRPYAGGELSAEQAWAAGSQ